MANYQPAETAVTRHADERCRQRGIRDRDLQRFLELADIDEPADHGCRYITISNRVRLTAGESRLAGMAAIIDGFRVVTVMHVTANARRSIRH